MAVAVVRTAIGDHDLTELLIHISTELFLSSIPFAQRQSKMESSNKTKFMHTTNRKSMMFAYLFIHLMAYYWPNISYKLFRIELWARDGRLSQFGAIDILWVNSHALEILRINYLQSQKTKIISVRNWFMGRYESRLECHDMFVCVRVDREM